MRTSQNWMKELAAHHEEARQHFPQDMLMVVCDIDGTILDMRHMIQYVLRLFDQHHGTQYFQNLEISDIIVHENHVNRLLTELDIHPEKQKEILDWYTRHRWTKEAILESHRPFSGVLDVIRWFQIQPDTSVGLNTGRPETIRADTLRSLNKLGRLYRVQFADELLHMNPGQWEQEVGNAKAGGLRRFQEEGYRIFAAIDNEPDNLEAIARINADQEILLLHADTIFESKRTKLPPHSVKGKEYDLTELIPEKALPRNIQFAWHGVNDEPNLRQFLGSEIRWAECDVRIDPTANKLILRHDSFKKTPLQEDEEWLTLRELLDLLKQRGKHVKFDLKAGGMLVEEILKLTDEYSFEDSQLWFNGNVEHVQEKGFRKIAAAHPNAILQCPVDFLVPLVCSAPEKAKDVLDLFVSWGINRFSISWLTSDMREFLDQMDKWGLDVNIYNVPGLEAFLQAAILMPRSITSDFNFPKWYYYGRGSGEEGRHYEYTIR